MKRPVPYLLAHAAAVIAMVSLVACDANRPTSPSLVPGGGAFAADRDRDVTIMTYNIYQGTELANAIAAKTQLQFVIGAAKDFSMMRQTNFAERATAIAAEISAHEPDLVGLQEVALWRTGVTTFPRTAATQVDQDFLQMLIDALAARGEHYSVVASVDNFDVQGPALFATGLMDVRLTDRDVILARARDQGALMALTNTQSANFASNLVVTTVGGPVTVLEGWASVDVKLRGRTMRFITTHLDAFSPLIRLAQASEILGGPANTDMPVVLTGDLNTTSTTSTYAALTAAGFADAWSALEPSSDGFTCCESLPAIDNALPSLSERIDLVLARGALEPKSITRVGAEPSTRTASGLWPSDHAGLAAVVTLDVHR